MTPVKSTLPAPEQRTIKIIACSRVTKPANIQVPAYRFPFYTVILVLIDIRCSTEHTVSYGWSVHTGTAVPWNTAYCTLYGKQMRYRTDTVVFVGSCKC